MDDAVIVILTIIIGIGILLLIREIVCWYWKVNIMAARLYSIEQSTERTKQYLKQLVEIEQNKTVTEKEEVKSEGEL